jgi:hypothetical protein
MITTRAKQGEQSSDVQGRAVGANFIGRTGWAS